MADSLPPRPDDRSRPQARSTRLPRFLWVIIAIGVVLILTVVVVAALPSNRWFWSKAFSKGPHTITYQVTGSGQSATVTYETPQGQTVSQDVSLPWETWFVAVSGAPLQIQAVSVDQGSITCRIKWEGHTISFDSESGGQPTACATDSTA